MDEHTALHASQEVHHEHTLYAETLFNIGGFPVTNSILTSWIAALVIIIIGTAIRVRITTIPGKLQGAFEVLIESFLGLCDQVTGNRQTSEKALPIALALFIFVLVNNWLGIVPGVGSISIATDHGMVSLLRGATADLNATLALGIFSVVVANVIGIATVGVWGTATKFIAVHELVNIKNVFKDPTQLIQIPVKIFVGLLELLGECAKIASLSFRLFGNVFAGEVLLASMSALIAYGVPLPFLFLEFFVGIIQAFIISLLTVVYITLASINHNEGHH